MTRALVVTAFVLSSAAFGQGKTLKDKEEIKFNEIERGFTVEMALGGSLLFGLPGNSVVVDSDRGSSTFGQNIGCKRGPLSGGETVRVEVGSDIASRGDDPRSSVPLLVVTAMMQAGQIRAGSDYLGTSSATRDSSAKSPCLSTAGTSPSGDFSTLAAGLAAKVNIVGFADSQGVSRLWIYARVAGGANFFFPNTLIKQIDVLLQAGGGVEYYTRLRHFAIGLEANFQALFVTTTFGVTITPTLRYSF